MSKPKPYSIFFFPNGMAAVCDADGNQIPDYQGKHQFTISALRRDGYQLKDIQNIFGTPQSQQQETL